MSEIHAKPTCVFIPHGMDQMLDPPVLASHSRQPDYQRRHSPSDYAPHELVASLALEATRTSTPHPTGCITGACIDTTCLLIAAAGPMRDIISLAQFPNPQTTPAQTLAAFAAATYRPWYARACAPLQQLVLNSRAPEGWGRTLWHADLPILAARSSQAVEFWQLQQKEQDNLAVATMEGAAAWEEREEEEEETNLVQKERKQEESREEDAARKRLQDARGPRILNNTWSLPETPLGAVHLSSGICTADVAWCNHMTQRCAVLRSDGCLLDVSLDPGRASIHSTHSSGRKKKERISSKGGSTLPTELHAPVGWAPSPTLLSELPSSSSFLSFGSTGGTNLSFKERIHSSSILRCTFTAIHPRQVVLSLHTLLGSIDLRGGAGLSSSCSSSSSMGYRRGNFSQRVYECPQGQWITALSAPPLGISRDHFLAASTVTEVLLFDLRRPQMVLARWEHGMEVGEGAVDGRKKGNHGPAVHAVLPDSIQWLPTTWGNCSTSTDDGTIGTGTGTAMDIDIGGVDYSQSQLPPSQQQQQQRNHGDLRTSTTRDGTRDGTSSTMHTVLVSNAWSGRGIVCEWKEERRRGGIAASLGGDIWEYDPVEISTSGTTDATAGVAGINTSGPPIGTAADVHPLPLPLPADSDFAWEPAWWTEMKPQKPPFLLIDLKIGCPTTVAGAAQRGRDMQRHRAAARDLENGIGVVDSEDKEGRKKARVRLLPSEISGPMTIGMVAIPCNKNWKGTRKGTIHGTASGTAGSTTDKVLLAVLSPSQEITVGEVSNNSTTSSSNGGVSTAGTAAGSVPMLTADLQAGQQQGNTQEEEVLYLDSRGQITQSPQERLAAAVAGREPSDGDQGAAAGSKARGSGFTEYPSFRVKQPVYADIPLHKWLLEEAVRLYRMNPEQYDSIYGDGGTAGNGPGVDPRQLQELLQAAHVPFTAYEAWNAFTAPETLGKKPLEGAAPSLQRKGRGNKIPPPDGATALTAALTRAGVIPLPEGVRAIPIKGASDSVGLEKLQSKAAFFPPSSFSGAIEASARSLTGDDGPSTSRAAAHTSEPSLRASALRYRMHQEGAGTPTVGGISEAGAWQVQPSTVVPGDGSCGGQVLFMLEKGSVESGSGRNVPVVGIKIAGKPPSVEAQAALDGLSAEWGRNVT